MKYIFTTYLLFFGFGVLAQHQVPDTIRINYAKNNKVQHGNVPNYIIDGKPMGAFKNLLMNPQSVADIKIDNKEAKIIVLTKNLRELTFLTLNEITAKYLKLDQSPVIFLINNELVTDVETYKIEEAYILDIQVYSAADFKYLKPTTNVFNVVRISLRTPENLKKASTILIR
jgi:hypothetical protein